MTALLVRPLAEGETDLFDSLQDPGLVGFAAFGGSFRAMADAGEYRPEWSWVAIRGSRVVARAAWWAGPDDDQPLALDWLDFDDPAAAVELLQTVPLQADYSVSLPLGWRKDPAVRGEADRRFGVARRAGMRQFVERYSYRWTSTLRLPDAPARLRYRAEPADDVILDVLRRIEVGTLDAHANRVVQSYGVDAAAWEDLKVLRWFPSPRDWWRLAFTPEGELVGLTVPARNHDDPVIGLIGVVPEQRGHGYGLDLLAEATRLLADQGANRIVASTDVGNVPMAAAFARAGYPITQERVFMEWPQQALGREVS